MALVDLSSPVGDPPARLVEAAGPDVGVKYPERRLLERRRGETSQPGAHEPPADPLTPGTWPEVDRVDLANPARVRIAVAARRIRNETEQDLASIRDQNPAAAVVHLGQQAFPLPHSLSRMKPVKVSLWQQPAIGTLPRVHVHNGDLGHVGDTRDPDDRVVHPPSVSGGSGDLWVAGQAGYRQGAWT